ADRRAARRTAGHRTAERSMRGDGPRAGGAGSPTSASHLAAAVARYAVPSRHSGPESASVAATSGLDEAPARPGNGPDLPSSSTFGGATASGLSSALLLGGLAVLVGALRLAGPRLRRHICFASAACGPAAFVPVLERPG
ncbi:MAG: hypothetical protein ACRDL0_19735, partial [Thermoleophilaceae bacterium]